MSRGVLEKQLAFEYDTVIQSTVLYRPEALELMAPLGHIMTTRSEAKRQKREVQFLPTFNWKFSV